MDEEGRTMDAVTLPLGEPEVVEKLCCSRTGFTLKNSKLIGGDVTILSRFKVCVYAMHVCVYG